MNAGSQARRQRWWRRFLAVALVIAAGFAAIFEPVVLPRIRERRLRELLADTSMKPCSLDGDAGDAESIPRLALVGSPFVVDRPIWGPIAVAEAVRIAHVLIAPSERRVHGQTTRPGRGNHDRIAALGRAITFRPRPSRGTELRARAERSRPIVMELSCVERTLPLPEDRGLGKAIDDTWAKLGAIGKTP